MVYAQSVTDLSVTVTTLTTVANATGVTGITIGVGFGAVSGSTCSLQIQTPIATLGQELFAPNGAGPGFTASRFSIAQPVPPAARRS